MAYQLSSPHAGLKRVSVFDRPSMSDEPDDEEELRRAPRFCHWQPASPACFPGMRSTADLVSWLSEAKVGLVCTGLLCAAPGGCVRCMAASALPELLYHALPPSSQLAYLGGCLPSQACSAGGREGQGCSWL